MKLEVGKYYVVRDPASMRIKKVRVDAIRLEKELGSSQAVCTEFSHLGIISSTTYTLEGKYWSSGDLDGRDLVAEYSEHPKPQLNITEADVGRKARYRDGSLVIITGFRRSASHYLALTTGESHLPNGRVCHEGENSRDIVELL